LNPRLAPAHAALGYIDLEYMRDRAAAKSELETAVALDPNDGESHHRMSHYWISLKTVPGSAYRGSSRRGMQSAELSIGAHMAFTRYEEGRFPEAIDAAAATLQLDASHAPTNW
jgi:hypothetical protein